MHKSHDTSIQLSDVSLTEAESVLMISVWTEVWFGKGTRYRQV